MAETAKVFVEIFDDDHEQKPRRRDFYFRPTVTVAEIKKEVENFIGISNVEMTVLLDGRVLSEGTLLQASGGVSVASKLRVTYKIEQAYTDVAPERVVAPGSSLLVIFKNELEVSMFSWFYFGSFYQALILVICNVQREKKSLCRRSFLPTRT